MRGTVDVIFWVLKYARFVKILCVWSCATLGVVSWMKFEKTKMLTHTYIYMYRKGEAVKLDFLSLTSATRKLRVKDLSVCGWR